HVAVWWPAALRAGRAGSARSWPRTWATCAHRAAAQPPRTGWSARAIPYELRPRPVRRRRWPARQGRGSRPDRLALSETRLQPRPCPLSTTAERRPGKVAAVDAPTAGPARLPMAPTRLRRRYSPVSRVGRGLCRHVLAPGGVRVGGSFARFG